MTTLENSMQDLLRWKPALITELKKQADARGIEWEEVSIDFEYRGKLPHPAYIFAVGAKPAVGAIDYRSLIVGAAIEEVMQVKIEKRFSPALISSEVMEFSEKYGKHRCGHPHNIVYEPRANGLPSYKSVVKSALKRSLPDGGQEEKKAQPAKVEKVAPPSGSGYLISEIRGNDEEVFLHVGMARLPKAVAEEITKLLDGQTQK